jgi:hypothetical protein
MIMRKGIGHIEAILAFVFFVGFLIFAFYFFNPFESNRTLDSTLTYATIEVGDYVKVDMESYSIVTNTMSGVIGVNIQGIPINYVAVVENNNGVRLDSHFEGGVIYFNRNGGNFFRILFSEEFTAGVNPVLMSSAVLLTDSDYSISSSGTEMIYYEGKFNDLKSLYDNGYENLKTQFNLPGRVDFGFSVVFNDGTKIVGERNIPENLEVTAKQDRIKVIRLNDKIEFSDLIVGVW